MSGWGWRPAQLGGPWFAAVAPYVARLATWPRWPTIAELDHALRDRLALAGVTLVEAPGKLRRRRRARPAVPVAPATIYELRIVDEGEVASRPGDLHDLLNALAWAAFPRAKRALTAQLAAAQRARLDGAATRLPGGRSRAHDRLAMLDEGGVIVAPARPLDRAPDAIAAAVAAQEATVHVFGHALLEHAAAGASAAPRGALVMLPPAAAAPLDRDDIDDIDGRLAAAIAAADPTGAPTRGVELGLTGVSLDPRWFAALS